MPIIICYKDKVKLAHEFFFPHPHLEGGQGYQILEVFALIKRTAAIQLGEL